MQVAIRTLQILSLIAEDTPQGLSMTEVADALALPQPTAHRLLKVLTSEGFLERNPDSLRYFPGEHLRRVAASIRRSTVAEFAEPYLRSLSDAFQETAFLAQWSGIRVICVALAESGRTLHVTVKIGTEMPLHAAASARVLLAHRFSEARIEQILGREPLPQFTDATPVKVSEVLERLHSIKERGFDVCDNELERNVWAISAPVHSEAGVVASLTLAAPIERSEDEALRGRMREAVFAASESLSSDLKLAGLA